MPRASRRTPTRAQVRRALDDLQRLFGREKKTPGSRPGAEEVAVQELAQDSAPPDARTVRAAHREWVDEYDRAERELMAKGYLR
jgi:hypothetical protein